MVAYNHYPRWASWQVASVLNPSLQYTVPASERSKHSRETHEGKAYRPWRGEDEDKLPLPPQYVSASDLLKAMPKYQARPKSILPSSSSPGFSPRSDLLAAGSPRSPPQPSARETPRSVLDHEQPKLQAQQAASVASPASPARSLMPTPPMTARPPVSAGYQNTPLRGPPSPRTRSAATSPRWPIPGVARDTALLRSRLEALVQGPEGMARVVQTECTAQGSPLSPASSVEASRVRRRVRNPHPPEPTLETYQKASPNTHATNTVWNDRRQQSHPRHSILIKST